MSWNSRNVSMKLWVIAGIAAALGAASPSAWASGPASTMPTVTVTGDGDVKAVPDEAILSTGVVTVAPTAAEALAANSRAMNEVFSALKRQGVPQKAVQTSEFNVSPQYDTGKDGTAAPQITGYQVTNSVSVTVDDLSKLGPAIDALAAAGANSMGGISFTIRDPKPLLREAREAAIKDAKERAETYAVSAGIALGRVVSIEESAPRMPEPAFRANVMVSAMAPTPIAAGQQTVSAHVTMTFEIK